MTTDPPAPRRLTTILTLIVAMTLPTALAYVYFIFLGGSGRPNLIQQATYASGKTFQFAIPILFFVLAVQGCKLAPCAPSVVMSSPGPRVFGSTRSPLPPPGLARCSSRCAPRA